MSRHTTAEDGQSIDIDAPPDIIDVVDEDDDIIDEKDPIPHDLAYSDDEDLVNLDIDDGVNVMSADVARGHGGDGGSDDCKGTRKPNLGGRRAGMMRPRQETWNLSDHTTHWANYLGELVRELPLYHPSWRQVEPKQKAGAVAMIGTQFDLRIHI
ncbi:hypothetical protein Tco_1504887 [Tanacetum coccineum]